MCLTLSQLAERFFAFMAGRNAEGTVYYYRLHVTRWIAAVGDLPVAEVKRHHLAEWGKCWHSIQAVQRLFNWAHVDMELIERNPFTTVKRPRPGRRRRVLARKEVVNLLRSSEPSFRGFLVAMVETIARPQEVRAFRWTQLRWDPQHATAAAALVVGDAYFELLEYKARDRRADPETPRRVFITPRLGRLLLRIMRRRLNDSDYVFANSVGRAWSSNAVRLRVRRLRRRCGLVADERGENVVAYSLRHTGATNACARGLPDRFLAEIMGHTSTRTTARYQHLSIDHLRSALRRLARDQKKKNEPGADKKGTEPQG